MPSAERIVMRIDNLLQSTSDIPSVKISLTKETFYRSFDGTLVAEDGKEFNLFCLGFFRVPEPGEGVHFVPPL